MVKFPPQSRYKRALLPVHHLLSLPPPGPGGGPVSLLSFHYGGLWSQTQGVSEESCYQLHQQGFNSGVVLYNLAGLRDSEEYNLELRKERMEELSKEYLERPDWSLGDQVLLALLLLLLFKVPHCSSLWPGLVHPPGLEQTSPGQGASLQVTIHQFSRYNRGIWKYLKKKKLFEARFVDRLYYTWPNVNKVGMHTFKSYLL